MAKPIPKKKVPAKTVQSFIETAKRDAADRQAYVDVIMGDQESTVADAVDLMVEKLWEMQGPVAIKVKGVTLPVSGNEIHELERIQNTNFRWIAVRCLVACAEWDIRIANFKAPSKNCLRCGKRVKS